MSDFNPPNRFPADSRKDHGDLSAETEQIVCREPDQQVTCTRVGTGPYRRNWWASQDRSDDTNPRLDSPIEGAHTIVKSRILRAVRTSAGVKVEGTGH